MPRQVEAQFGPLGGAFATIEEVFSGRGYAALRDRSDTREGAGGFAQTYARLLATLARDLMLAFLPRRGIFFAGGVARNLLASPARAAFCETFRAPFALNTVQAAPVFSILDDAAALKGCASFKR